MINNQRVKEVLLAIANNQTLEVKDDIKEVCKVFKDQSLIHQLYNVFQVEFLKKYYLSGIVLKQYQDTTLDELKDLFNKNGIDFILLKGSFVKKFYPNHFLRLMGDIDVLVREKDLKLASEILENYNFKKGHEWLHHIEFEKNNIVIELHHKLFSTNFSWTSYFDNPWDYGEIVKEHEYEFNPIFCYLYQLGHLAKHMLSDGAGLRPYIDFYYMLQKFPVDIEKLMGVASEVELDKFLNSVLNVVAYLFDYAPYEYEKMTYLDEYITHIIEVGVHGHSSNNNYYANRLAGARESKFKFYLHSLFPSREIMKKNYTYLNKYPILFPIARIQRIFRCIFIKGKDVKKVNNADAQKDKLIKLYDEIGLKK